VIKQTSRQKPFGLVTQITSYLLMVLPGALAFLYVRLFGVNVPYWDQWWIVTLFEKLNAGSLHMSDLWSQANEHRIFFPRVAMLLLGSVTGYNNVAEMYFILGLFLVTLIVLLLAFKGSVNTTLLMFVPVSFLMFSP
jgi:hypothetical protein